MFLLQVSGGAFLCRVLFLCQAGLLDDAQAMLAVQSYLEYSDEADSFSGLAEVAVESLKCLKG